jgi:hypothetical protein
MDAVTGGHRGCTGSHRDAQGHRNAVTGGHRDAVMTGGHMLGCTGKGGAGGGAQRCTGVLLLRGQVWLEMDTAPQALQAGASGWDRCCCASDRD